MLLRKRPRTHVAPGAELVIADDVVLGEGTVITVHAGTVRIEEGVTLGDRCRIVAHAGVTIGRNAWLGHGVVCTDFAPTIADPETPTRLQPLQAQPITIGEGARVGHGACLQRGATVGPHDEVAPHAVLGRR